MPRSIAEDTKQVRLIHIRLKPEIHKKLRVLTAELDTSIQEWVSSVIEQKVTAARTGGRRR